MFLNIITINLTLSFILLLPINIFEDVKSLINDQKKYQYQAFCTDGDGALTIWLESKDAANKAGKDHEVKTKGHRWDLKEREKPKKKKDDI